MKGGDWPAGATGGAGSFPAGGIPELQQRYGGKDTPVDQAGMVLMNKYRSRGRPKMQKMMTASTSPSHHPKHLDDRASEPAARQDWHPAESKGSINNSTQVTVPGQFNRPSPYRNVETGVQRRPDRGSFEAGRSSVGYSSVTDSSQSKSDEPDLPKTTKSFRLRLKGMRNYVHNNPKHLLACACALIFTCGEVVLRKSVYANLFHYRWFLIQLSQMLTFLGFAAYTIIRFFVTRDPGQPRITMPSFWRSGRRRRMPKNRSYSLLDEPLVAPVDVDNSTSPAPIETTIDTLSWREVVGIATLEVFHALLVIPVGVLPGPVQAILPLGLGSALQAVVALCTCELIDVLPPVSCAQLAWTVLLGVGIYIFLFLGDHGNQFKNESTGAIVAFMISFVPLMISNIYKKMVLSTKAIEMNHLNLWVAPIQIIFGFLLASLGFALQYVDFKNSSQLVSLNTIGDHFVHGFGCLAGQNFYPEDTCDKNYVGPQVAAYFFCIIAARASFYGVLTLNESGPREAQVQGVGATGSFVAGLVLYCNAVPEFLWGYALSKNGGPIPTYQLSMQTGWPIFGIVLIAISVWMISRKADRQRPPGPDPFAIYRPERRRRKD